MKRRLKNQFNIKGRTWARLHYGSIVTSVLIEGNGEGCHFI